ncbi:hypothetical protein DFJ77DRAFT_335038 [Powellomyces hirtus]|nr:hypothetical protein DFJ77DRAFT_335038 [Powellomyces hirtus]
MGLPGSGLGQLECERTQNEQANEQSSEQPNEQAGMPPEDIGVGLSAAEPPLSVPTRPSSPPLPANGRQIDELLRDIDMRLERLEVAMSRLIPGQLGTGDSSPAVVISPFPNADLIRPSSVDERSESSLTRFVRSIPSRAVRVARTQAIRQIQSFAVKTGTSLLMFLWIRKLRKVFLQYAILILFRLQWARQGLLKRTGRRVMELATRVLQ